MAFILKTGKEIKIQTSPNGFSFSFVRDWPSSLKNHICQELKRPMAQCDWKLNTDRVMMMIDEDKARLA